MRPLPRTVSVTALSCLALLYVPLVAVAVLSFNKTRLGTAWGGFTTGWYERLLSNTTVLTAAKNSLIVACVSTLVATVIGTLLAIGLRRLPLGRRGRLLGEMATTLPTVTPDVLLAAALVVSYGLFRTVSSVFDPGLVTLIIGHITFQISFVAVVVGSRLAAIGTDQIEAARDLYASTGLLWRRVLLPQLAPGIVAGGLLAFTLSLDDFVVSFFVSGPSSTTLPILIYASVKRGVTPEIHALSTLIVAATMLTILGIALLDRRNPRSSRP